MSVLVVQHLVTLAEATKIMRLFKQKKHAGHGYFFELQDLGASMNKATVMPGLRPYRGGIISLSPSSSYWQENAYILRVHREIPDR